MTNAVVETVPESLVQRLTETPAPAAETQTNAEHPATAENAQPEETPEQVAAAAEEKEKARQAYKRREERKQFKRSVELETENRLLRERLQSEKPAATTTPAEPKRDDFPDYEAYLDARADWRADQKLEARLKSERESRQGQERQNQSAANQQKQVADWTKREKEFSATAKDYDDIATAFVDDEIGQFSNEARAAIVELGPQMLYYLAKNPKVADSIKELSELAQVRELGRLEDKLKPVEGKKNSDAPAPAKPNPQGKSGGNKDPEKMSVDEWAAHLASLGAYGLRK